MSSGKTERPAKPGAPQWAMQPFDDFMDFVERLGEVVELSTLGISTLRGMPKLVEAVAKAHGMADTLDTKAQLERAQRLAELAHRESSTGFPLIHAQATVTLWGALEDLIRSFVAKWLQQVPTVLLNSPLSTLKVPVGEYEKLSPEEKGIFLADALDRSMNGALKQGVTRFEALLEPLGLSGSVPENVRKEIFELGQVRHAIAHRRGIADRRLLEACPWLTVSPGSTLLMSHRDFGRYHDAVVRYVTELVYRVGEHFGVSAMRDAASQVIQSNTVPPNARADSG